MKKKTVKSVVVEGRVYEIREIPTRLGLRLITVADQAEMMAEILRECVRVDGKKVSDVDEIPFADAVMLLSEIMELSQLTQVNELLEKLPKNP